MLESLATDKRSSLHLLIAKKLTIMLVFHCATLKSLATDKRSILLGHLLIAKKIDNTLQLTSRPNKLVFHCATLKRLVPDKRSSLLAPFVNGKEN
jgi:hypothetical protein